MEAGYVYVFVLLLSKAKFSCQDNSWHKPEHADKVEDPSEQAMLEWEQAVKVGKTSGKYTHTFIILKL